MPIEDLIAMYYNNANDGNGDAHKMNATVPNDENNLHDGGGEYTENAMEGDDNNPFENQRVTRGCKFSFHCFSMLY